VLAGGVGGVLSVLAYPPWGWWPLALVAYVPLLVWILRDRPSVRQAAWAGVVQGTVLHLCVYWFLVFTMQSMSGFPWALAVAVHVFYSGIMGIHQGLFASLATTVFGQDRQTGPASVRTALTLAALYMVIEFAVPFLFPWYLGNAFYQTSTWIQAADLVGVVGVSGLAMACNVLIALALVRPVVRRLSLVSAAVLLLAWGSYGLLRIQMVTGVPVQRVFHATLVQADATLREKLSDGRARLPMLDRTEALTRTADLHDTDLVIWPEGALPFFWVVDDLSPGAPKSPTHAPQILRDTKRRVLDLVRALDKPILFGSLRRLDRMWLQEARNAAFLIRPSGESWVYDKKILLPFGEYLPGTSLFPALKESIPGVSHMDPGTTSGRVDVAGTRLLVNICYEALFPAFLRGEGSDADVFVNLTNDIWFGPQPAPELHLMVQQARAVELRRPLLRSTVTGITAMVDVTGAIMGRTQLHEQAVRRFDVDVRQVGSLYRLCGDTPMWLLTVGMVAWLVWRRRRASLAAATGSAAVPRTRG
jgi:apolipoprotein N-acyltransferase